MIRLSLYPGETEDQGVTRGHIYVYIDDKLSATFPACAGPSGPPTRDQGGHLKTQTPAGQYVLGSPEHHVTGGWPLSSIPWGAQLRHRDDGDVEWSMDGVTWRPATGPEGTLTLAGIVFRSKDLRRPLSDNEKQQVMEQYRAWLDPVVGAMDVTYRQNDFGQWAWNLNQPAGRWTSYFVHTTPNDEAATAAGRPFLLSNSHGCVHIRPADRDVMMRNGWLEAGIPFFVVPYGKVGPLGLA
jgi:hypothetical protein